MKKSFVILALVGTVCCAQAQEKKIVDVFKAMPDSLLPYLSLNNRLDMVDFMEANMKAEVTNRLEGQSELTALTPDSLSLKMSDALLVDLKLLEIDDPVDSANYIVSLTRNYRLRDGQTERVVSVYSAAWRLLSSQVEHSTLLRRDEELLLK